jgi:hypothetical protein
MELAPWVLIVTVLAAIALTRAGLALSVPLPLIFLAEFVLILLG